MASRASDTLDELLTLAIVLGGSAALALIVQVWIEAGWLIWRAW